MNQYKTEHVQSVKNLSEDFRSGIVERIIRNLLDIQILRLIQAQPMWGYRIKKEVETAFNVKLRHGALYPLLNSLEEKGFTTSQRQQQGGRVRKVYLITQRGEQYVEAYHTVLKEQLKSEDVTQ